MTPLPFFSIIIPTYNSERVILECLDSISKQTFTGYEILVIDGLSTDNTMEIVRAKERDFERLAYVSEKDEGIYDAMNKGIGNAKGQWLYFLGSNDLLFDECVLDDVYREAEKGDADILYGNVLMDHSKEIYAGKFDAEKIYEKNISHQAIFFKKPIFDMTGTFDLKYHSNADWDHNFKWFFHDGIRKRHIDRVVAVFSETGFSSHYIDRAFRSKKAELYLGQAGKTISRKYRAEIYRFIAVKKKESGNKLSFLYYAFKYFLYRI